jgi:hypothetical protein
MNTKQLLGCDHFKNEKPFNRTALVKPTVLKKKSASSAMGSSKIFSYEDTCT